MTQKQYKIYNSCADSFDRALDDLLVQICTTGQTVVRIIFFGSSTDNEEYALQRSTIETRLKEHFSKTPMVAYIAQAPLSATLVAEVTYVGTEEKIEYFDDYILLDDCQILSGAIYSDYMHGIAQQSEAIFKRIQTILNRHNIPIDNIVRQWNYIERITHIGDEGQHYQLFNDARSHFYNQCKWANGYPAATGIGTQYGGVVVLFDALRHTDNSIAIDNPLQISAHTYSEQVLINTTQAKKTTPKFERARYIAEKTPTIYISGTAAIRGEESCREDVVRQTALTMENIDHLISLNNQIASGVKHPGDMKYVLLRAYIKDRDHFSQVQSWMQIHYPTLETIYLLADICREELLIEIEGIAIEDKTKI